MSEAERQGGTIGCRAGIAPTRLGIRMPAVPHTAAFISVKAMPLLEPMLISVLELLRIKAGHDHSQRVCFEVR